MKRLTLPKKFGSGLILNYGCRNSSIDNGS
jgi:hypothetical protein